MKKVKFDRFGAMLQCASNAVYTVDAIKKFIDIIAQLDYNTLYMDISTVLTLEDEPYFGYMRGQYTKAELQEVDAYALSKGIEVIPILQTLAHLDPMFRWSKFGAIRDNQGILLVGEEKTYAFIDCMLKTVAETFTSKTVHLGMDEAFTLGKGQYYDKNGDRPGTEIMKTHLDKVLDMTKKYGFVCEMWGDMYIRLAYGEYDTGDFTCDKAEEVAKYVPENVTLVYWDYYSLEKSHYDDRIEKFLRLTDNVSFAGGAWNWLGFCPDNTYGIEATKQAFASCLEHKIKDVFITTWGDNGGETTVFSVLPTFVCAAEFAKGNFDMETIKKKFKRIVGMDFEAFMALELPDKMKCAPNVNPEMYLVDPTKYLLFNDPFRGIFDTTLYADENEKDHFTQTAEILKPYTKNKQWGHIFKMEVALCKVMDIKARLGLNTRKIYKTGDKNALRNLANNEYAKVIKAMREFYSSFETYWMKDRKPHGFDVQDIRLGGLIQRLEHCKKMLLDYANGKTDKIAEIEEELLDFRGHNKDYHPGSSTWNQYQYIVTVNEL